MDHEMTPQMVSAPKQRSTEATGTVKQKVHYLL